MMVDFEKTFNSEKMKELYEKIRQRAIEEHWCSTCRHCQDERDGLWCDLLKDIAEQTCFFYDFDPTKV